MQEHHPHQSVSCMKINHACDLIFFKTDIWPPKSEFTARADLFLKYCISFPEDRFCLTLMKCRIMWHFIWVFAVCQSTCLGVSVLNSLRVKFEVNLVYFNCLPEVMWLLVFCGSSSWCCGLILSVLWLFLMMLWADLQCVIVVLPDHTHLLFRIFWIHRLGFIHELLISYICFWRERAAATWLLYFKP